jgi:uncharacterized protein (TIGR02677 family)
LTARTEALEQDRLRLFRFAGGADNGSLYVGVLRAFDRGRERHELVVGPDRVAELLDGAAFDADELQRALDQLVDWGVLERSQDGARVRSLSDFRRRRSRYGLSPMGLSAWTAVRGVLEADPQPPELRRLAFASLLDALHGLADAVAAGDAEGTNRRLHETDRTLAELAERSTRFSVGLASALRSAEATPELFLAFKDRLLAHVDAFLATLQAHLPALAIAVARVEDAGVERMLELATSAEAADALASPSVRRAHWAACWQGVVAWFGRGDGPSKAEQLDFSATAGIRELLALLRRVVEARREGVSRATQLESLGAWLGRLDDAAARAVFQAALSVRTVRWLRTYREDPRAIEPGTSWRTAPPEPVSHSLRHHGRQGSTGRPAPVRDVDLLDALLRRKLTAERNAARHAGAAVIHAVDQQRPLTPDELRAVLGLLGRALATGVPQRSRIGREGGLVLHLEPDPEVTSLLVAETGTVRLPGARLSLAGGGAT